MSKMTPIIDASLFMGMHHANSTIRARSMAFFTGHFHSKIHMSFSQIGICDALVWRKPRKTQDAYYPFMDVLHSEMEILRQGYTDAVLERAVDDDLASLSPERRLQAALVVEMGQPFFTHDEHFLTCSAVAPYLAIFPENHAEHGSFPAHLDALYQKSTVLVVTEKDFPHDY